MEKQTSHRLSIWNLADGTPRQMEQDHLHRSGRPSAESQKLTHVLDILDEFAVLEKLYDYGPSIAVELHGVCTAPNGRQISCKTKRIGTNAVDFGYHGLSREDLRMSCADLPEGIPMQLDLDQIGSIRGQLAAKDIDGFQIAVANDCKSGLGESIARIARSSNIVIDDGEPNDRILRVEPRQTRCTFTDHIGIVRKGKIVNVSRIDALIKAAYVPPVGSTIILNGSPRRAADVTRSFEIGCAVNFRVPIPAAEFSVNMVFFDN